MTKQLSFPSNYRFYDYKEADINPFDVAHLAQLVNVVAENDVVLMLNTFNQCLSQDVRQLTTGDFKYLIYYQWFNTFGGTLSVEWVSKYGNNNISMVGIDDFSVQQPSITDEEFAEYSEFTVPRTLELMIVDDSISAELRWLYDKSQYYKGATLYDKVMACSNSGVNGLTRLNDFIKMTDHGIDRSLKVKDSKFEYSGYLAKLVEQRDRLSFACHSTDKFDLFEEFSNKLYEVEQWINGINVRINGAKLEVAPMYLIDLPEVEEIEVNIDISTFID